MLCTFLPTVTNVKGRYCNQVKIHISKFLKMSKDQVFYTRLKYFQIISVCLLSPSFQLSYRPSASARVLTVCPSVGHIRLPVYPFSVFPSVHLSVYPSACLLNFLSVHLANYPTACPSVFPSIYLSVCLSFHM